MCKKPPGTITPWGFRFGADLKFSFLRAFIVPRPQRKRNKNMHLYALKRARMAYKGPRAAHRSTRHGHALQGVLGHEKSPALQIRAFLNRESSMTRGRLHLAGFIVPRIPRTSKAAQKARLPSLSTVQRLTAPSSTSRRRLYFAASTMTNARSVGSPLSSLGPKNMRPME